MRGPTPSCGICASRSEPSNMRRSSLGKGGENMRTHASPTFSLAERWLRLLVHAATEVLKQPKQDSRWRDGPCTSAPEPAPEALKS